MSDDRIPPQPVWAPVTLIQFEQWIKRFAPPLRREIAPGGPTEVVYWHGDEIVASYDMNAGAGHVVRTDLMPIFATAL